MSTRKLKLLLHARCSTEIWAFESGAYSIVFADLKSSRAYKLFCQNWGGQGKSDEVRRATFDAEVAAYTVTSAQSELSAWVPKFYGSFQVDGVRQEDGKDVSHQFHLDCCYAMELVNGKALKIGNPAWSRHDHLKHATRRFWRHGIRYMRDCSVFFPSNPLGFKFIDFATKGIDEGMVEELDPMDDDEP
jgi:hypothetical protein